MKRVLNILITVFVLTILSSKVYADSFSVSLDGENEFSYEVDLKVTLDSIDGFDNGLSGLDATLSYDKTKLEILSVTSLNSFDIVFDKKKSDVFEAYSFKEVLPGSKIALIKFKNIGLNDRESTDINLINLTGSNGIKDIVGTCLPKTVTFIKPEYQKGDMNRNGKIDLQDIIVLLKKYLKSSEITDEDLSIGDMDNNESIEIKDIILLLRKYLGTN